MELNFTNENCLVRLHAIHYFIFLSLFQYNLKMMLSRELKYYLKVFLVYWLC